MRYRNIKLSSLIAGKVFVYKLCSPQRYGKKILQALRTIFPHIVFTEKWYRWFTFLHPYGRCLWFITKDAKKTVATYGFLPIRAVIRRRQYEAALAVNSGLFPCYWGTIVYQEFGRFCLNTVTGNFRKKFIVAISNNIIYAAHLKLGWIEAGKIVFMDLEKDAIGKVVEYLSETKEAQNGDIERPPASLNKFIRHVSRSYDLFIYKDASIIKWRYSRIDYKGSYSLLLVNNDKKTLGGYAVIKDYCNNSQGVKKLHIVDLACEDFVMFKSLMKSICLTAIRQDSDIINTGVYSGSIAWEYFLKTYFKENGIKRHFLIYSRDARIKKILKGAKNIHFSLGDNDVF